jgi:xanthine/CO dehydrogenase XdhC/CoxF family maturation factor
VREIAEIASRLAQLAPQPAWLATVVAVQGSAYRRPGARLLFSRDGKLAGGISGGCLEREVMRTGEWLAQRGPVLRIFDATRDDDGHRVVRSGCNGQVEVLIQEVTPALSETLQRAAGELAQQRSIALTTLLPSGRFFLEQLEPAPHLSVFGIGDDVVPIARLATQVGFDVTVRAAHGGFGARARFSGVAPLALAPAADHALQHYARLFAVVMTHDYEQDRATLAALLRSAARYIGMLGPAHRTRRMLTEIQAREASPPERLACVHGPAGLHLGGEGPEAIALSIVAEAQAVLHGKQAGSLRSRRGPIHDQDQPAVRVLQAEGA